MLQMVQEKNEIAESESDFMFEFCYFPHFLQGRSKDGPAEKAPVLQNNSQNFLIIKHAPLNP